MIFPFRILQKELVIEATEQYKKKFYNTSIPKVNFPAPVVFTANRYEEDAPFSPLSFPWDDLKNIMAIRLRVSSTNLKWIDLGVTQWAKGMGIPVTLTFMAYYTDQPADKDKYEWRVRHINSYLCPNKDFMVETLKREKEIGGDLVCACGIETGYCKDCQNCERLYNRIMAKAELSNYNFERECL